MGRIPTVLQHCISRDIHPHLALEPQGHSCRMDLDEHGFDQEGDRGSGLENMEGSETRGSP